MVNTGTQSTKRQIERVRLRIDELLDEGFKAEEIQERLKISRDRYFRYRSKTRDEQTKKYFDPTLQNIKPLKTIDKTLNPIQFCNKYLPVKPNYMQSLMIKAFYSLPLSEKEKMDLLQMKRKGRTTWEEGSKYNEIVVIVGMKGGKTVFASLIGQIEEYELFKIGDISRHYLMAPGQRIYIKNVATTAEQAEKTIFAQIQSSIERSPYFKARAPELKGKTFFFADTNVYIESGHSNSSALVGDACKCVLLDELDRFMTSSGRSSAEEVYHALDKSTDIFRMDGKKVSITSLMNDKGFSVSLYGKCARIKSMLGFWMPEWEMQPERYSGQFFFFRNIPIPVEHRDSFDKDPEKFLRDKACILGFSKGAYYKEKDRIIEIFKKSSNEGYKNPIDDQGRFNPEFKAKPGLKYFEHHDPAKSRDSYAIAIGHEENERTIIDMCHRIQPKQGGEIDAEEIKSFCELLHDRFPSIELITYDTWAAAALMQHFKKRGFKTENLYILKTQHDLLKEKIYADKFRCHECIAEKELIELELVNDRVDHPAGGSKDAADAIAGVTWSCFANPGVSVSAAGFTQHSEDRKKESRDGLGFRPGQITRRRKSIWERSLD